MVLEALADLFSEDSDVKLEDRFGMRSPVFIYIILSIYLLTVLKLLPSFMKSRPAYQLKASSALYPIFLNSVVHIVMYLYYLMAAVLPAKTVAKLEPVKKAITTFQMVQFFLFLVQVVVVTIAGCYIPPMILGMHVMIVSAFFYMFYDFYKKNYNKNKNQQANKSVKH